MFDFFFDLLPHFGLDLAHSHDVPHHAHGVEAPHTCFAGDNLNEQINNLPNILKQINGSGAGGGIPDIKGLGNNLRELTKLADSLGELQSKLDGMGQGGLE